MIQRFFDIFFSSLAIIFLLPIIIPVMIILKFTGEREIFYTQKRIGKDMKPFKLFKFATMLKNSENLGAGTITLQNDSRVLPFGKILRKTKINELPQLFNIVIGDMSIVGPRPLLSKQFFFYPEDVQPIIASIKPGLSGIGSLAFRDEESLFNDANDPDEFYKNNITPAKAFLEIWYVNNKSMKLYFMIIIFTALSVILKDYDFIKYIDKNITDEYRRLLEKR